MSLDFMKPDVWDGLVLGTVLIGLSLAILRLMSDRIVYKREQEMQRWKAEHMSGEPEQHAEEDHD
jgi:hypothetical protein